MSYVTDKFRGPGKVAIKIKGISSGALILKLKDENSYLSIRNGNIVGYVGVTPQPYRLRLVAQITEAEYTNALAVKSDTDIVEDVAAKLAK